MDRGKRKNNNVKVQKFFYFIFCEFTEGSFVLKKAGLKCSYKKKKMLVYKIFFVLFNVIKKSRVLKRNKKRTNFCFDNSVVLEVRKSYCLF